MRGFVLRLARLWQRARRAGARQPLADALEHGSLAAIAPGHAPAGWLAAFAYGLLMCSLWIARGDLVSRISARAVTNAALAVYVRATGSWALW